MTNIIVNCFNAALLLFWGDLDLGLGLGLVRIRFRVGLEPGLELGLGG